MCAGKKTLFGEAVALAAQTQTGVVIPDITNTFLTGITDEHYVQDLNAMTDEVMVSRP